MAACGATLVRVCKRVVSNGKGKEERIPGDSVRRCAWPSIPLVSCEHLRGGYSGAGPRASPGDMPWRFHGESEVTPVVADALASLPKDWAKEVVEAEENADE